MSAVSPTRSDRLGALVLALVLPCLPACLEYERRAVIYYNVSQLPVSAEGESYQHFASIGGYVVDLGCFVVEPRQINCFDFRVDQFGDVHPNIFNALVECECPCTEPMPDPCDRSSTPALVTRGVLRGTVDTFHPILRLGGAEFPTPVELRDATEIFITVQSDDDAPRPSEEVILRAALTPGGSVLRGDLENPQRLPVRGSVTIVPTRDGASL
jgi:hypothetical protein